MVNVTFNFLTAEQAAAFLAKHIGAAAPDAAIPVAVIPAGAVVETKPKRGRPAKADAAPAPVVAPSGKPVIDGVERDATEADVRAVFGSICSANGIPTGRAIMAKHDADVFTLQSKDDPATTTKRILDKARYNEFYLNCMNPEFVKNCKTQAGA